MASSLELTLLYLVAAVAGVVLCRLSRLPPILGYLAVGTLIGPHAMAVSGGDAAGVSHLAEFGIVFLMFVIGLEFNLPKLQQHEEAGLRPRAEPGGADDPCRARRQRAPGLGLAIAGKRGLGLDWQGPSPSAAPSR
jgi:hypothetical protein